MKKSLSASSDRYFLIDALRGFAIINMVAFHLLYDLFAIYGLNSGWFFQPFASVWERFICCSFILISGVSFNFSKHAYKRGIILNVFGFALTIVTVLIIPEQAIWFGILNFLGCAMLILQPLRKYAEKIPPVIGAVSSLLIFSVLYGIPNGYAGFLDFRIFDLPDFMYQFKWLSFFGFPSADFFSSDYFPIIPWIFLFFAGYFIWRFIMEQNADKIFKLKVPLLDVIGRFSLWIYIAHQPVIMGILFLIMKTLI